MKLHPIDDEPHLFEAFIRQLEEANLPTADLRLEPVRYYALLARGGEARAFGGFLPLGEEALLRSVIVSTAARASGFGRSLVRGLCDLAATSGAKRFWLLTTTAETFFLNLGWIPRPRKDAPKCIASTHQFASVCPASAILMHRDLA